MKAKKSTGKPAAKRASKDLAPRKAKDVKGGSFFSDIVGSVVKSIDVGGPAAPVAPVKPAN
jgi:hypothetical protein